MSDKDLNVSNINFNDIKTSLKDFVKNYTDSDGNQVFTDYNFEGSALSVLFDVLSYNAHLNAMHSNLAFSESFLDSANKRSSVASRAKELGYLPRSKSSAISRLRLSLNFSTNQINYTIPKFTKFTSTINNKVYTFQTLKDSAKIYSGIGTTTLLMDIDVVEGDRVNYTYTVNLSNLAQRFIIPSKDVDSSTLKVFVKTSEASLDVAEEYSLYDGSGSINANSKVYFLQESYDGFYEVLFGDNYFGKALSNNNFISLEYNISNGENANDLTNFTLVTPLSGVLSTSVANITESNGNIVGSFGGGDRETIDSIKFLAPRYYSSQNRAVTEEDYKTQILKTVSIVDDVSIWGGEKNEPPVFGKVFIALKPKAGFFISNVVKQDILDKFISNFNVVGIRPEIVDPDYIFVEPRITAIYDSKQTTNTSILSIIKNNAYNFITNVNNKFSKSLYFSSFIESLKNSIENNIVSLNVNFTLYKEIKIITGVAGIYNIKFNNSIEPNSLASNTIRIGLDDFYFTDIPDSNLENIPTTGKLAVYKLSGQDKIYLTKDAGVIDYNTGEITISNVTIDSIPQDTLYNKLKIYVGQGNFINSIDPKNVYTDYNIYTNERDQLITIKSINDIQVNLIPHV